MTTIKQNRHTIPTRAGIYCRISDDRDGLGLGVERQRKDCVALAHRLGWAVADTYIDNDISAYRGKRRPEWERLLDGIATGQITAIIAWHQDRLNRSPRELEHLIDLLERHHIEVQTVTAGLIDVNTATGRAVARIVGAMARMESDRQSTRIKAKKMEVALTGAINCGPNRPFGYADDKITIVPSEAKIIRAVMKRFLAGESAASLSTSLNKRGITTTGGHPWRPHHLARVLTEARIAGWRAAPQSGPSYHDIGAEFLVPAQWKAIVTRAQVERARTIMQDDTLRPGSRSRWLLSGIALCGVCGLPMTSSLADTPERRYSCSASRWTPTDRCGTVSVTHRIEADIIERLHAAVAQGLVRRILHADHDVYAVTSDATHVTESKLRELGHERDDGQITHAEWAARRNRIQRRAVVLRTAARELPLADLPTVGNTRSTFARTWQTANVRRKRAILYALTLDITVQRCPPGVGRYDPTRVQVTWRS